MNSFAKLLILPLFFQSCESMRLNKAKKWDERGVRAVTASKKDGKRDEQKLNEAITYFNKSIEINPHSKYVYINRGITYHYLKKNRLAIADYNRSIAMFPDNPLGYHNRAIARQDSGLYQEALSDYLTAKDLNRKECSVYYNLGTLHYSMDDYPTALEYYEKATECREDYALAYLSMGEINRMMRDYETALRNLNKALKLDPSYTEAYEERGLVYLKQAKYELALEDLDKAINLSAKSYKAFFYRGLVKRSLNKQEEAGEDFLKAGELKPYKGTAMYSIGRLFSENKDYSDAILYYERSLKLEQTVSTYNSLGYCHLILHNNEAALAAFSEGIRMDTLNTNLLNSRGMVYTNLMKYDSAIVDFKKCMRLRPAYLYPYNNLANCYFALKQQDKACEYWKLAVSKGYVYNPEWKAAFGIEDPKELVKLHCK